MNRVHLFVFALAAAVLPLMSATPAKAGTSESHVHIYNQTTDSSIWVTLYSIRAGCERGGCSTSSEILGAYCVNPEKENKVGVRHQLVTVRLEFVRGEGCHSHDRPILLDKSYPFPAHHELAQFSIAGSLSNYHIGFTTR